MMPRISVVMPAYQHEAFVTESVSSVLDQSFHDFEIVITDDASTDGTVDAIRAIDDARISLDVNEVNRGGVTTANLCIARARGEFIALLNTDDCFLPGKLEAQVKYLDAHPATGAVFGLPALIDERGEPLTDPDAPYVRLYAPENRAVWCDKDRFAWLRVFFHSGNALCHPTMLIRRAVYDMLGFYDPRLTQLPDFDMWLRLCARYEVGVIEEPLTAFRLLDNERNTSGVRPDSSARLAWESERVLHRFRALGEGDFRRAFATDLAEIETDGPLPQDLALARLALAHESPSHRLFGINLLYDLAENDEVLAREIGAVAGRFDPLGVNSRAALAQNDAEVEFLRVALPRLFGGRGG